MFRRLSRNKRGISVAISSVIMVAAVITVGLTVVAWTTSTFARQQSETAQFFSDRSQTIRENFVVEDVWFNASTSPKKVDITVRNVGEVGMNVTAIHFNATILAQNQVITNGTAVTIHIQNALLTWSQGDYFYVKVVSARGQQIREYYSTSG